MQSIRYKSAFAMLFLLFFVWCASRDNPYDPKSPHYVNEPPHLQVNVGTEAPFEDVWKLSADTFRTKPGTNLELLLEIFDDGDNAGGHVNYGTQSVEWQIKLNARIDTTFRCLDSCLHLTVSDSGLYEIRSTATDGEGASSSKTLWFVSIPNRQPYILWARAIPGTLQIDVPETVLFVASVRDTDGVIDRFEWDFNGQQEAKTDLSLAVTPHSYLDTLKVYVDPQNNLDLSPVIRTASADPIAMYRGQKVAFACSAADTGGQYVSSLFRVFDKAGLGDNKTVQLFVDNPLSGPQLSYRWDFGDGATSTQQNPVHVFADTGEYTTTIEVHNYHGAKTHRILHVYVYDSTHVPPLSIPHLNTVADVTVSSIGLSWDTCTHPGFLNYIVLRKDPTDVSADSTSLPIITDRKKTSQVDWPLPSNSAYSYTVWAVASSFDTTTGKTATVYAASNSHSYRTSRVEMASNVYCGRIPGDQVGELDGILSEPFWGFPNENLLVPAVAALSSYGTVDGDADCSVKVWLKWHENDALYVAAEVHDSDLRVPNGITGDGCEDDCLVLWVRRYPTDDGIQIQIRMEPNDNTLYWWAGGSGQEVSKSNVEANGFYYAISSSGPPFLVEMKLLWGDFFGEAPPDTGGWEIGFNIGANDNDGGFKVRDSAIRWTGSEPPSREAWGILTLIP